MAISANQFWAGELLESQDALQVIPLTSSLTLLLLKVAVKVAGASWDTMEPRMRETPGGDIVE